MFEWIKKHKIIIVVIIIANIFLIPFIIHILFKIEAVNDFFVAEWTAGELLGYYGAVLSFLGTVILGALSLYQNHLLKIETDKRTALLEEREYERNMPKFRVAQTASNGENSNLRIRVWNITENRATDIKVYDIEMLIKDEVVWKSNKGFSRVTLSEKEDLVVDLDNPIVSDINTIVVMKMKCNDKYFEPHNYIVRGTIDEKSKHFVFKPTEI
ncbi:MAG: hypothetical protein IJD58_10030 [Lachnospiraceae bacterium]|nr:hypothetical protein [Lachnospiraceae bacterium]